MDKWKALQACAVSAALASAGTEMIWQRHEADLHAHQETPETLDQQIGRSAVEFAVTTGYQIPFVNPMDGNERRLYRPNWSSDYSSPGEPPLPLRILSIIR